MHSMAVLSICIPTYNRASYLHGCLRAIMSSAEGYEEHVEVIISDNNSTDNTEDAVRQLQRIYPGVRYFRNPVNIGCDRNVYKLATMATGRYVLFLGDDDTLAQEAISEIFCRIRDGEANLVVCNFSILSKDFQSVQRKRYYNFGADVSVRDADRALKVFGVNLAYLSHVVIKRSIFFTIEKHDYDQYADYGFSFLYAAYRAIFAGCILEYIDKPIIQNRANNARYPEWCKGYAIGLPLLLDDLRSHGYSKNAIKKAKNGVINSFIINFIINAKADGRGYADVYEALAKFYSTCWSYWLLCVPLRFVPDPILKILKLTYRKTIKRYAA